MILGKDRKVLKVLHRKVTNQVVVHKVQPTQVQKVRQVRLLRAQEVLVVTKDQQVMMDLKVLKVLPVLKD